MGLVNALELAENEKVHRKPARACCHSIIIPQHISLIKSALFCKMFNDVLYTKLVENQRNGLALIY